jgi:hypothetical protein
MSRIPSPFSSQLIYAQEKDFAAMPTNKLKPTGVHYRTALTGLLNAYNAQQTDEFPALTAEEIRELPLETKILLARNCVMVAKQTCEKIEGLAQGFAGG